MGQPEPQVCFTQENLCQWLAGHRARVAVCIYVHACTHLSLGLVSLGLARERQKRETCCPVLKPVPLLFQRPK